MFGRSLFLALSVSLLWSPCGHAWQLEPTDDASSVKVWTQPIPGSNFKAFRGEIEIQAPVKTVLKTVTDTESYPEWYHNAKETKILKKLNDRQGLSYSVTDAPWPVSDRDSVTLSTKKSLENGGYLIELQAKPDAYPKQPRLIRIPKLNGFWKLIKLNENSTRVILQISAEPGGKLPSWLVNSTVIDMPYYTLSNLKNRLENRSPTDDLFE